MAGLDGGLQDNDEDDGMPTPNKHSTVDHSTFAREEDLGQIAILNEDSFTYAASNAQSTTESEVKSRNTGRNDNIRRRPSPGSKPSPDPFGYMESSGSTSTRSSPRSPFLLSRAGPVSGLRSPALHAHSPSLRHQCVHCSHPSPRHAAANSARRQGSTHQSFHDGTSQDEEIETLDLGKSMMSFGHSSSDTPRHSRRGTANSSYSQSSPRYLRRERSSSGSKLRSPSLKKRPSLTSTYRGSSDDDQLESAIGQDSYLSGDMSDLALTDLIEEPLEYESEEGHLDHSRQPSAQSFVTAHERDETLEAGASSDEELETVHYPGIPRSNTMTLDARLFKTAKFAQKVLHLVRDLIKVPGWADETLSLVAEDVRLFKVSGSMTNAVIFVSYEWGVQGDDSKHAHGQAASTAGQKDGKRPTSQRRTPPTLLLRIYGSSSGQLISRRRELHILHILSTTYAIGPRVFGTFANGRIEEYFASRALCKEELRDQSISCWIGRRMRELHGVRLDWVIRVPRRHRPHRRPVSANPVRKARNTSSVAISNAAERPGPYALQEGGETTGTSTSLSSYSSTASIDSGTASDDSTSTTTSVNTSKDRERSMSLSDRRIHAHGPSSSLSGRVRKFKAGVWRNFDKWIIEAKKVLDLIDRVPYGLLVALVADWNEARDATGLWGVEEKRIDEAVWLRALRDSIDMPGFEQALREYRDWIANWEATNGSSEMVFAHNDAQYGNLLLLNNSPPNMPPHHALIVVDLEYASANPRAFDIANHFHEWRADYHHADLPHLLEHLSFPNREERRRFLGAYVDQGRVLDQELLKSPLLSFEDRPTIASRSRSELAKLSAEDWQHEREGQIDRLEEEVSVWSPSSHAMWATWGIVQARDAIMSRIAEAQKRGNSKGFGSNDSVWKDPAKLVIPGTTVRNPIASNNGHGAMDEDVEKWSRDFERLDKEAHDPEMGHANGGRGDDRKSNLSQGHAVVSDNGLDKQPGEEGMEDQEAASASLGEIEFDYLGYAAHRIHLFREDWARLKRGDMLPA